LTVQRKILIVDDHAVVRAGLRQILAETVDLVAADEACNGVEALGKIRDDGYEMVLLDITMPGRSGLEILKDIKALKPKLPVLILSIHTEELYALRALRAGASGYLTKESAPDELVAAIRKILLGKKYVSSALAEEMVYSLGSEAGRPFHEELSDREYQVLCLIASGKRAVEIADELSLSPKTISTYRTRILKKLNLKNNAELTHYALKNCLVE
jgi:DNA-binding NarL/FixJ family response regulator